MPQAHSIAGTAAPDSRTPGAGVLAIWHDVAPGHSAVVREWYAREHHAERLALPGFVDARRYDRVSGAGADVFGLYSVRSPDVVRHEAYQERLAAPSKWTRAVMPHFRNTTLAACGIAAEAGRGEGGHMAALACAAGSLVAGATLCAQLLAIPGVLRVRALAAARHADPDPDSAEQALRGARDARIAWALLADADSAEAAQTALYSARAQAGLSDPVQCAIYRLAHCARNHS